MIGKANSYPARLKITYQEKHDRLRSFLRLLWAIPILIVMSALTSSGDTLMIKEIGNEASYSGGGITGGLFFATLLMIVFRRKYPQWWFDFVLELNRFTTRVWAYVLLLTDRYPSTTEEQSVKLEIDYPNVKKDLNDLLPLVKWLLAIPHYFALFVLVLAAILATVLTWLSIIFTGKAPRGLFDFVEGVLRWGLRVNAYAFLLVTDKYPPFSLK